MDRFIDQPLRTAPHIAVVFYDSIGDFVVATPLLRGLREKYPGATLDYLGGERTRELECASCLIDSRFSLFGDPTGLSSLPAYVQRRVDEAGPYDLAINCEAHPAARVALNVIGPRYVVGPAYQPDLRGDLPYSEQRVDQLHRERWNDSRLLERFGDVLESQYIAEVFCRLAHVQTDFARTEVPVVEPGAPVPPVLIATGANRSAKLWPEDYWQQIVRWCQDEGLDVGLLGSAPAEQARFYHSSAMEARLLGTSAVVDLRGRFALPEVAGALARAKLCVTIDNGIMHLAAAVGTATVAIFGGSPWRLWTPPVAWVHAVLPAEPCSLCEENQFHNEACLLPRHVCAQSVTPARVIAAMRGALAGGEASG
jgi:ADP-heptose:LPS heptosyltransferase